MKSIEDQLLLKKFIYSYSIKRKIISFNVYVFFMYPCVQMHRCERGFFWGGGVFVVRTFIQYIQERAKDDVVVEHRTKKEDLFAIASTNKKKINRFFNVNLF